jgi:hypothetical protein
METGITIVAGLAYILLWYKKKYVALGVTIVAILIATGIFGWQYFHDSYQRKHVEVSVEYKPEKFEISDSISKSKFEIEIDPSMSKEDIRTKIKKQVKEGVKLPEIDELVEFTDQRKWFPLRITIRNGSNRTIIKTEFTIGVFEKGRSTNLAKTHDYSSDKILKPSDVDTSNWAVPIEKDFEKAKTYNYRIQYSHVYFE